jgi:hypothetical protein
VTPRLRDLPDDEQARIRALADAAPELTDRQRERLQLLFRQADVQAGDPP